ncbi:MAG: hypothetical protein HY611_04825 [Elusimicrobia bacterium]|nr:hypothetical protein [Elusimicrobiota bacterium]
MENPGSTPEMKTLAANALADYPGLSPASDPLWRGESFLSTPRKRAVTLLKRQLSSEAEKNLEARVQERLRELFGGRSEEEARQNPLIIEKVRKFLQGEKSEITLVKDLKDIEKFTQTQVPTAETMQEAQKAAEELSPRGPPPDKSEIRDMLSLQPRPPPEAPRIIKPGETAPGHKGDLILPGRPPSEAPRIIKPGEPAPKPAAIEPSRNSETSPAARTVEEIFREAKSIIRAQELKAVADAKFDAYAAGSGLNAPEKLALRHLRDSVVADVISEHAADRFVRGVLHGQASSEDVFDYMVLQTEVLKSLKIPDITGFRENQKSLYLNFLEMLQEAKAKGVDIRQALLAYLLLETGGGKTLLSFLGLIPLAEALSRELHLEGTIFATLSDLLKYQAIEDYKSYFSGKSPSFEILSYSDLNSRKLMAAMTGDYSPYETHVIIADELDGLALQPPISMGKDNGRIGAANPLYQVYHRLYGEILSGALRKLRGEDLEKALDGLAQKYAAEAQRVYGEMKSGPYRKEAEQAFSVAKRQFGGVEPYWKETVRNLHEAAFIAEPSRVMEVDGEKGKMLPVHHGSIYATLDTPSRNFFELKNNFDLTLPYDHVETTNFRSVMEEARYLIGLSGTLPQGMLPFLHKLNMIVRGRATQGHDSRLVVSRSPMETVTTLTREALRVENANGGKNFVGIVVNSMRELQSVEEALIRSGVSAQERIARVYPGMTYWKEMRYQAERVAKESNLGAMERGDAEVVLIVSETGGRGWNPKLKKYRGTVTMIKMYPEEYASVTRNQVEGRFDVGRLHAEARSRYVDLIGRDKFAANPEVREIALKSAQSAVEISAPQTKDRAAALKKLEAEDPVAYAFVRAANAKNLQRAVKDAREGNWTRLDKLVSNPIVAARVLKRVQQTVEDRVLREALSPPAEARNRALLSLQTVAGQLGKKSVLIPMGGSMAAYWLTQSLVASSMTFPFSLLAPIGASMAAGQALRYFFKEKPSEKTPQESGVGT